MIKKHKKIVVLILSTFCVFVFLLSLYFFNRNAIKKGELCILDQQNNILAEYSAKKSKLGFSEKTKNDYVVGVLCEAKTILSDIYSEDIDKKTLLNSDLKIITYFSDSAFKSLSKSFENISFEDGKLAEAVICLPDGKIIASIGQSQDKNAVTATHKAGSAIKPLSVYAPAFKNNVINWGSLLIDAPFSKIQSNGTLRDWPSNYNGVYLKTNVSVEYALKKSLNTIAVSVLDDLKPSLSCQFLESVGISATYEKEIAQRVPTDVYGNLALGELKDGLTCERLAAAYQIFANGGKYTKGRYIAEIYCGEEKIYTDNSTSKRVLTKEQAKIMNLLLEAPLSDGGTAQQAKIEGLKIIGKTGTSQGYKDNWFIGVTPDYICSVWYGYKEDQTSRDKNITFDIFKSTISALPVIKSDFPDCNTLLKKSYCVYTGALASDNCPETKIGYYEKNNLPKKCIRH